MLPGRFDVRQLPRQSTSCLERRDGKNLPRFSRKPGHCFERWQRRRRLGRDCLSNANPSLDLQKQRHEFALTMRVGLGEDGFKLITRCLPRNL
jgi:hypothetical protein